MSTLQEQSSSQWHLRSPGEFSAFAGQRLAPILQNCETDRRATARNLLTAYGILGVIAIIAAIIAALSARSPAAILFVLIPALAIAALIHQMVISGYRARFKRNLVAPIISFLGPEFQYDPQASITEGQFALSQMFQHDIDRFRGEDHISGIAGRTRFECSEIHAEYKTRTTDSKGRSRTQWHTIFKGLFFIADFNKHFNGITLVVPDVAQKSLGWIGQKLQEWNFTRPGSLVKLEDADFERSFAVYSTDQIEARYILSPALMRRLVELQQQFRRPIHLSFTAECVFLALDPGKNLLEPAVFTPITSETCLALFQDISMVLGLIDELNLNTRIWTKQ